MSVPPKAEICLYSKWKNFGAIFLCAGLLAGCSKQGSGSSGEESREPGKASKADQLARELYPKLRTLELTEAKIQETVWAKESVAEQCEAVVIQLWDRINHSANKLEAALDFHAAHWRLPFYKNEEQLPHGISTRQPEQEGGSASPAEWKQWLQAKMAEGWGLQQLELRHTRFSLEPNPSMAASEFYFFAGLTNKDASARISLEGPLKIRWTFRPGASSSEAPAVDEIDASSLRLQAKHGLPLFRLQADKTFEPPPRNPFIDPLIVYDLDGDGELEIILAALNQVFHYRSGALESAGLLCDRPSGLITSALIADFNADGYPDLLCAKRAGLSLYRGAGQSHFSSEPLSAWIADPGLKYALAMTCGDMDRDGDLDVWLTQYKVPYLGGQLPTPYHDANDGYPSFLLQNDGSGRFQDATETSGLAAKRFRRTYSSSFVDLDDDGNLDLVVASDFAGTDLYRNDGKGHFQDKTAEWLDVPYAAGMAHALADFNRDNLIDLLTVGMTSPTVDRLESLRLSRHEPGFDESKRALLMGGNRLYARQPGAIQFRQDGLSQSVQRAGWAWGCSAFDFDNDSFLDLYLANGHETKASARDYDSEFWLHDVHIGNSSESQLNLLYFSSKAGRTRARDWSYGGWERNRLFWNRGASTMLDISHASGASLQQDSRNVVAADLDRDGRQDLIVTTFEAWPEKKQTLKIYINQVAASGNWVAVAVPDQASGPSAIGAVATLQTPAFTTKRPLVTGDSFRSQSPNLVHFGLGKETWIEQLKVTWPDGSQWSATNAALNTIHTAAPSPRKK
jgi:hypothetical protein